MKDAILTCLPEIFPWKDRIVCLDTTDSTNTQAKLLAAQGAPHGTAVLARHQTGGRGRMGRTFSSPAGMGMYLSLILRPDCTPDKLMHLTCATAVAACDAVESLSGLRPGIKWTNDLVIGSKKLGGILTELVLDASGKIRYAIVGIGINCLQQTPDFPTELQATAVSLSAVTGMTLSPTQMAAAMLSALAKMDGDLLTCRSQIMDIYRKDCITPGREVMLLRNDTRKYGKALRVEDDGGLLVAFADGTEEVVTSGEISIRGMYGYV